MKILLFLVTFFLLLNSFATAQSLIQDSCKKASVGDPNFKVDFCVKSLQANPQSKSAKSLEELLIASIKMAATKMTSLKEMADKLLKEKKFPKEGEMLISDCLEAFTDNIVTLNDEALKSVKSRDYKSASTQLSAAMDAPGDCETGFEESETPVKSPFTKDDDVLTQMVLIPLAFNNMLIHKMNLLKV